MKKIYLIKALEEASQKTNKQKFNILLDMLLCKIKYKANSKDYYYFEMFNATAFERSTFITKGKNNDLIKKYNNPKYIKNSNNPLEFHKIFAKFLNKEWIELNNLKEFKKFCSKHKEIVAYTNKKLKKISTKEINIDKLYKELIGKKYILVEEFVKPTNNINKIFLDADIFIKIITLLGKSCLAYIYVEEQALIAPIDIETGSINGAFVSLENNNVADTKETLITNWTELKETIENACLEIPELGYVEWTFKLGEKRTYLLKANASPNHYLYQRPPHREHNIGVVPIIKKIEERKIEN